MTPAQRRFGAAWARAHDADAAAASGADRTADHTAVGAFRLRPAQVIARRRILTAFEKFGGALLADPPGTGKTVIALAVAHAVAGDAGAVVVAPAALRDQWARSARRAGVAVRFASMEAMSRTARVDRPDGAIVIIDEAHHARTPGTRRHTRLTALCSGARVLLLSATPVVNRIAERDAMLSLFLAERMHDDRALERCIVRREAQVAAAPRVRRAAALRLPARACDARIAMRLASLPPPLPAADGRAALALVRMSLAMAWSSSLAALDAALRRRLQRGEAIADLLEAGGTPSRAAVREWVIGDDATQLAFPSLFAAPSSSDRDTDDARRVLDRHLGAVRALRGIVRGEVEADSRDRARLILDVLGERPDERLVVFSRQAWTIRALWTALRSERGVVAVVGDRTFAAHGTWRRDEVLGALGPRAKPLRDDDPRAIRLLLTTDLLAEGVELQGVARLIHADRAWTPATMEQREGRIARGTRREVTVTRILAPREAGPFLRLGARLVRKDRARRHAVRHATCLETADAAFRDWASGSERCTAEPRTAGDARCSAFLAALRVTHSDTRAEHLSFVAGERRARGWRISRSICAIARTARSVPVAPNAADLDAIRRALARWSRRRTAHDLVDRDETTSRRTSQRWRQLRRRIDAIIRATPHADRARRALALEHALAALRTAGAAALQHALARLLAIPPEPRELAFERSLLEVAAGMQRPATSPQTIGRPKLLTLVAFEAPPRQPASPAP